MNFVALFRKQLQLATVIAPSSPPTDSGETLAYNYQRLESLETTQITGNFPNSIVSFQVSE